MTGPCDYAACHEAAVALEDGWEFCGPHLDEHRAEARDSHITRLHALGATDVQIAGNVGCDKSTVQRVRIRLALPPNAPSRAVTDTRDDDLARLHALGMSDFEIAAELNVSRATIYRSRVRLGLPLNPSQTKKGPPVTAPCGTPSAARRHHRYGEPLCEPCRKAQAADTRKAGYTTSQKRWAS